MPYKNKDYAKEKARDYYWKNRDKILKRKKEQREDLKIKEKIKSYSQEYNQRPESKIIRKKYTQREDVKQKQREYAQRPEIKQRTKEYLKNPEVKEKKKLYTKKYEKKPETIENRKGYIKKYCSKPKTKILIRKNSKKYSKDGRYKLRKIKYYQTPNVKIAYRIRNRLRHAIERYYKTGKIMDSEKYGIDFGAIINHLKPFPKELSNYHIDHIKPICSFTFVKDNGSQNIEEIKRAFSPENLQWLTVEENLKKGGKWDGK